jgi:hypothetical protein
MTTGEVFQEGPQGREIRVDASGALIASEGGGDFLVYQFGPKGRPLAVDANGRLRINSSAPFTQVDSPTASGAFDLGQTKQIDVILDKNVVYTDFENPVNGGKFLFILEQTGAGSFTVTWPSNVKWRGAAEPTLSTASGNIDVVSMVYRERDDTFLADYGLDFQ